MVVHFCPTTDPYDTHSFLMNWQPIMGAVKLQVSSSLPVRVQAMTGLQNRILIAPVLARLTPKRDPGHRPGQPAQMPRRSG